MTKGVYSKRQINMPFTINPMGKAHDFCKVVSAFIRGKNRRSKCHKQKLMQFTINFIKNIEYAGKAK